MNLGSLFQKSVSYAPQKLAICQKDQRITYGQLADRTHRLKSLLLEQGLQQGDKVLFLMLNDYRFAECLFACMQLGIVPVPVNIKLSEYIVQFIAANSGAKWAICSDLFKYTTVAMVARSDNSLYGHWVLDEEDGYEQRLQNSAPNTSVVSVTPTSTALMMYTSGSTGKPKGCLLGHHGTYWMVKRICHSFFLEDTDSALVVGPMYHANALWCMFYPVLHTGGTLHIMSYFDAADTLRKIHENRPTFLSGTPSMFSLMLACKDEIKALKLDSLEFVLVGSAPITEKQLEALQATFGCGIVEGYGSTEAGTATLLPRWGIQRIGSIGLPLLDVAYSVMDTKSLKSVKKGETGELWLKSPAMFLGYHGQPKTFSEKFHQDWYRTGDLVMEDADGYLFFKGRTDDMINCGGENIYPKEVTNLLLQHERVSAAEVVAVPHKIKGMAPVAWVKLKPNTKLTEMDLKTFTIDNGPAYAHPRRVFFTDDFPLNGTNKIDYGQLREMTKLKLPEGL